MWHAAGRKYNVPLLIRQPTYSGIFTVVMNGRTIINICPTRYIFKQSPGSVDEVVDFFNLSEGTKNFLTTANPGECVISLNNSVTAIKFVITEYEKEFVFT